MSTLGGRVAAITGAGRGIGRDHALFMAAEGCAVVVNDLVSSFDDPAAAVAAEIRSAGGEAVALTGDVSRSDVAEALVSTAVETFGDVHVLVNNAGILRDRTLVNMTDDDWDLSLRVNLRGTFAPARAAARYWRGRAKAGHSPAASIVNTSSESGVFANAGQSNYAAAKAAVATLTEVWHKELGRYGVRVNAILPRARTRLTDSEHIQPRPGAFDIWDPANVSPFVGFLATESCPLSGCVFLVAGGVVQSTAPWSLDAAWRLKRDTRWTVEDLASAVAEVGTPSTADRDTGLVR